MSIRETRINHLNSYAERLANLQLERNPLASEIVIIFNDTVYDQYQDSKVCEIDRVKKLAVVKKNTDMHYVQELLDELLEDDIEKIPWIVTMTTTDLPRIPCFNDCLIIDGIKYTISMVKPANRNLQSLINVLIYPERNEDIDYSEIYQVSLKTVDGKVINYNDAQDKRLLIDIIYGGTPTSYSFDQITWKPFKSKFGIYLGADSTVFESIKDWDNVILHPIGTNYTGIMADNTLKVLEHKPRIYFDLGDRRKTIEIETL